MENLLVTGGSGFIGSNFIRYLLQDTDFKGRIINVDKLTYAGNPENLEDIEEKFPGRLIFVKSDICDLPAMEAVFRDYSIDTVCHFAAESHVDRSITGPSDFIQTNIIGTFNLLECARKNKDTLELFHHVSTDEVFGSLGKVGLFTENTSYKPNSPYSASKASSDHLVRAYFKTYDIPVTISNCSNNYGPYQFPEKLVPLIILNALEEKQLPVYGDGKNVRDWLYVKDHCHAIKLVLEKGKRGETYNIGGNNEMENIRIVELICDNLDRYQAPNNHKSRRELITFVKDRPGHDRRYAIDSTKIQRELGWQPAESFETGLVKTIDWYLENRGWIERVKSGEYKSWISKQYGKS
ncbi:MAG: dTDP-glucose 4,6-dehydratase [Deltaproteobacteria bacterium]|nr:dTDP-glucose 4,6-dehydratase [Deltaproteobacteria bacterium]